MGAQVGTILETMTAFSAVVHIWFHSLVCTSTKFHIPKQKSTTFTYRSYKHFNKALFLNDLSVIPYHVTEIFDDIDDAYSVWNELTMQVVNEHAPVKTKTIKGTRVPYMNGELRRAINVRNMFKRKYDKCKNSCHWKQYRNQRNLVTKLRKKSMNVFLRNKCNTTSGSGKEFWETVKPLISSKSINKNDNIIILANDNVVTQQDKVATVFNDYFTNMAKDIGSDDCINVDDNVPSCLAKHNQHDSVKNIKQFMESFDTHVDFYFHDVSIDVVKSHLCKLKTNKATGYDMLPAKLLKMGSDILCNQICYLLNMSLTTCTFPRYLKYAEICPVYKKGNNLDVSNYRPVSILPSMSKIFEKEIVNQVSVYFEKVFSPYVSGFRQQHSCETVLLRMVENIKKSVESGKVVCVVLMDLSRAFDCIPYKLFISKLRAYGLSQSACKLFLSYYMDRKQRVKLGNIKSEWKNVYKGAAQEPLMGPQSYNMFTNDMPFVLEDDIDIYNYADDNTFVSSGYDYESVKNKLVHNVNNVISWFEGNNMMVNPDKFQCIVFGRNENLGSFRIGEHDLFPENIVKILGLHLDSNLNFDTHISKLCQKAGNQINVLARLCNVLNEPSKMLLYNSFVECYFNYCSVVWHFCSKYNTYKIEKLQEKALRFIKMDFNSSYGILLNNCNKHPLYVVRIRKFMEAIYKISHGKYPIYLNALIKHKNVQINLRSENDMCIPQYKTIKYGKNSFKYSAPFYWNKLPNVVKNAQNFNHFKTLLHDWVPSCVCGSCLQCNIFNR